MNQRIINRVHIISNHIIKTNDTIRKTALLFNVSKSTVHKDLQRLNDLDKNKYLKIKTIMQHHLQERHLKGGASTRQLFLNKKKLSL